MSAVASEARPEPLTAEKLLQIIHYTDNYMGDYSALTDDETRLGRMLKSLIESVIRKEKRSAENYW